MAQPSRSRVFLNQLRADGLAPSLAACRRAVGERLVMPDAIYNAGEVVRRGVQSVRQWVPARSLVSEILVLQFLASVLIGGVAIVGLWFTSTWAIHDSLERWGHRWIAELDDFGVPLFRSANADRFLQIEAYLKSFPEISFVRFYTPTGETVFEDFQGENVRPGNPLGSGYLESLASSGVDAGAQVLEEPLNDSPLIRISKAIWVESFKDDGLIGLDLDDPDAVKAELVGFVELGLNFAAYQAQLTRNIILTSLLGCLFLMLLTAASGIFFRRALTPLSKLQEPLKELADGRTDFSVESSGHKEIVAIADALNTTVSSLNERDRKLWQLANHDTLTGLMNRHRFGEKLLEEITRVQRHRLTSALLFIDLDQFKYVNDTLGHAAGDRLLKQAAGRLQSGIRKGDVLSRFGGDEFTVLLSDVKEKDVKSVCTGLLQDMRDFRFHDGGQTFNVPCSIGVAMITSAKLSPAELMARADAACHDAKRRGRNRFQLYKASGEEMRQMSADFNWSQKIQAALKEDGFALRYQPIVDVQTGQPTHHEVLLRMRTEGKLIPPTAFLPAASRFGLMTDIDEWVIRNATRELARLRAAGHPLTFTINISGNIFEDADLYGCIAENLERNALPPEFVVLEITEQVAVRNITRAAQQIEEISRLGCRFAIDDFGAGYSSYTYLKSLPVDYIKIHGSFVANLGSDAVDRTIVESISQIAKATHKQTIAEHVTDAATFAVLRQVGVDFAQGHYIGRPASRPGRRAIVVPIERARKRRSQKAG